MSHSSRPDYETQSEVSFVRPNPLRSLSPDDIHKMKYKIDLGQSEEKLNERTNELKIDFR